MKMAEVGGGLEDNSTLNHDLSQTDPENSVNNHANQKGMDLLKFVFQLFHLVLAAVIFLIGVVEFSVEPSVFDVFGRERENQKMLFENASTTASSKSLGHILDAPILFLFLIYFLSVLWLKCRGMFAWILTGSQVISILLYLGVNAGLSRAGLDWRYFSTRAVTIILDVLILSFAWTVVVVTLLHVRGWFPFKVKKYRDIPYHQRSLCQKIVVITWNFIALYMVLSLCFLIWFSKLYMSWACVRHSGEILLMCQFTNMVQCWPCIESNDQCTAGNITQCIDDDSYEQQIRCISPLYLTEAFPSAVCVFNYNIGPFTFVTVFSYVGGIYFFMRTVLNAMVKCLFSIIFVTIHFIKFKVVKKNSYDIKDAESVSVNVEVHESSEDTSASGLQVSSDPRVSLLGPLPHYFNGTSKPTTAKGKSKYI